LISGGAEIIVPGADTVNSKSIQGTAAAIEKAGAKALNYGAKVLSGEASLIDDSLNLLGAGKAKIWEIGESAISKATSVVDDAWSTLNSVKAGIIRSGERAIAETTTNIRRVLNDVDHIGGGVINELLPKPALVTGETIAVPSKNTISEHLGLDKPYFSSSTDGIGSGHVGSSGKAVRRDDYMYSHEGPVNKNGEQTYKSYIDKETGDLHPSNVNGEATVVTHIRGKRNGVGEGSKSDSAYTSFTEGVSGDAHFGEKEIFLDLAQLRSDIANKQVVGVKILENKTLLKFFERRVRNAETILAQEKLIGTQNLKVYKGAVSTANHDLDNLRSTKEILIKGIIPSKYLKTTQGESL
jgi:hypothetical protein